jgi:hypothetical protein
MTIFSIEEMHESVPSFSWYQTDGAAGESLLQFCYGWDGKIFVNRVTEVSPKGVI